MIKSALIVTAIVLVLLSGCSTRSGIPPTTDNDKILISYNSIRYRHGIESLGEVRVVQRGRSSYGLLGRLANKAREMGAHAVIDVTTWTGPYWFSLGSVRATGEAVRFESGFDVTQLNGEWR